MTPEERRGWTRVAASITTYAVIGCALAGGLWIFITVLAAVGGAIMPQ